MALRVMIVDDDIVSQFDVQYRLKQTKKNDLEITISDSAEKALEECKRLMNNYNLLPDVILLDLSMGKMSGWDLVDELQSINKCYTPPRVYILSSFIDSKNREIAKNHAIIKGFYDKPITVKNLNDIFDKVAF